MTLSARAQQALTARSITGGIIRPDPSAPGFWLTLANRGRRAEPRALT